MKVKTSFKWEYKFTQERIFQNIVEKKSRGQPVNKCLRTLVSLLECIYDLMLRETQDRSTESRMTAVIQLIFDVHPILRFIHILRVARRAQYGIKHNIHKIPRTCAVSIQCYFDAVGKRCCDGDVIFKPNTALM